MSYAEFNIDAAKNASIKDWASRNGYVIIDCGGEDSFRLRSYAAAVNGECVPHPLHPSKVIVVRKTK